MWLQLLSSIYYGIFLALASVALVVALWVVVEKGRVNWKTVTGLMAGGVLALLLTIAAARPYIQNTAIVGTRPTE